MSLVLRNNTAISRHCLPWRWRSINCSAIQVASSMKVGCHRAVTLPGGTSGRAASSGVSEPMFCLTRLAKWITCCPDLRFKVRWRVSEGSPSLIGKWLGKPQKLSREAPRHSYRVWSESPHHRERESFAEQQLQDHPLGGVGVLVFVGHRCPVTLSDPPGDLRPHGENPMSLGDQIAVINHPQAELVLLVPAGRLGHARSLAEGGHQAPVVVELTFQPEVRPYQIGHW